jgi:pSer/pThr/pTyr-binding forkhead associated (FHA) protein
VSGNAATAAAAGERAAPAASDLEPSDTRVFEVPRPPVPRAVLQVTDPDGQSRRIVVEAGSLTIGRATDNDLIARDGRVSRHHGRNTGRRGTLDNDHHGSTNGSRVNGVPVTEVVLGAGDRLEIGDTALVVEVAGAPN